jgi:pimeloyl-ACP methyl ester carboxylesterase
MLSSFDVVGFDPPGVGHTAPITCLDGKELDRYFHVDPAPTTASGLDALIAAAATFARGCEARSAAELPYVSTVDAAMDLDFVRQALGDAKLTYIGFSYGSLLGQVYAGLYPTHIRAMVIDGVLDPAISEFTLVDQQAASLDNELRQFFAACVSSPSCPWKPGPDPAAAFQALLQSVRQRPLPVPGTSRTVGPAELLYGTAWPLYFTSTWPDAEKALAQASQGNGYGLLAEADSYNNRNSDGTYENLLEANAAVDCLDEPPTTVAQVEAAAATAKRDAPVFGELDLYGDLTCAEWPVKSTGTVAPVRAAGSPPILVVGSTGDPITPYQWAQAVASQLQNAVLLTRVGDGHTGYGASSCVRTLVDQYLISLSVPPAGTRCSSS